MNIWKWLAKIGVKKVRNDVRIEEVGERKYALVERAKVGISPRLNDAVVREAIEAGQPIYLTVRKGDGFVLTNSAARPAYSSKEFVERYPEGAARTVMYVEADPRDPLADVELGEDGCWWYRPK